MQALRTIVWIVVTAILVAFIAMNWEKAPVNLWPLSEGYLLFEWPVGVLALVFFLLGAVPVWLLHRMARWRLERRIASLENSLRVAAAVSPVPAPAAPESAASQTPIPINDETHDESPISPQEPDRNVS